MIAFIVVACVFILTLYVCKNRILGIGTQDPFAASEKGMKFTVCRNTCLFCASVFAAAILEGALMYALWAPPGMWSLVACAGAGLVMCLGLLAYASIAIVLHKEMRRMKRVAALYPQE